jgi:hypothetical protein
MRRLSCIETIHEELTGCTKHLHISVFACGNAEAAASLPRQRIKKKPPSQSNGGQVEPQARLL